MRNKCTLKNIRKKSPLKLMLSPLNLLRCTNLQQKITTKIRKSMFMMSNPPRKKNLSFSPVRQGQSISPHNQLSRTLPTKKVASEQNSNIQIQY